MSFYSNRKRFTQIACLSSLGAAKAVDSTAFNASSDTAVVKTIFSAENFAKFLNEDESKKKNFQLYYKWSNILQINWGNRYQIAVVGC